MERKGFITGLECLALQGFPLEHLDEDKLSSLDFTDAKLKDLAGNSFPAHVFMAVLLGFLTFCPAALLRPGVAEQSGKEFVASVNEILDDL